MSNRASGTRCSACVLVCISGFAAQKEHIGSGEVMLAVAPGNIFDADAGRATVDPAHAIEEEDQNSQKRNELEKPLGETVVAGRRLVAPEQIVVDRRRGLTGTSIVLWSGPKRARR
jgi:hypothetical protein